jgi:uncharacterized protein
LYPKTDAMRRIMLLIPFIILTGCRDRTYHKLKDYLETIDIVDAHEHQQIPSDSAGFCFFNTVSYYPSDLFSAGATFAYDQQEGKLDVDSLWSRYGKYYNYTRTTSYHDQLIYSLRILYDFKKPYLEKSDIKPLYDKMLENNYRNYPQWFDYVFHKLRIKTMVLDQYWNHFNTEVDTNYFSLVCNINSCVTLVSEAAGNKKITSDKNLLKLMKISEIPSLALDDYLALVDNVLEIFKSRHAVCLKNTLAYSRTLYFEDVSYDDAVKIYNQKEPLDAKGRKMLEDFVFHHIVKQSIKLQLPIQVHTGYLAGNNARLDNGQPMKLLNVLMKYPKAKFILFHGGYPWTSDYVALGKNFSNVWLDIVWLPQISKTEAMRTFNEMLDCVPYNKYMWGGDVTRIDDVAGSLELAKEVVATVLAERVEKGWMTVDVAMDVERAIFQDNATEIFKLKK